MASVNKVILIGNLGQDPEIRSFPNGGQIANLRIATTERWRDRQTGEQKEQTEWHTVVLNERLAELAGQYLRKGSPVYIEGSLRTRKWQDANGNNRYSTEVRGQSLQFLGSKGDAQDGGSYANAAPSPYANATNAASARAPMPQNNNYGNQNQMQPRQGTGNAQASKPPAFNEFDDDDIPF